MQLVILAAGKGTRMRPLTYEVTKAMIPLKGKPKLAWTLENLPKEIDEVVIVINHLGKQIKDYFGNSFSNRGIKYVLQEKLEGTGAAVHACKDVLKDRFLVMMGDDLYHPDDVEKMAKEDLAILVFEETGASTAAAMIVDEAGNFVKIIESDEPSFPKNERKLVNTALYTLNQKFFNYPLVKIYNGELGLPQTIATMVDDHEIGLVKAKNWVPLSKVDDIATAEKELEKFF